MSMTDDMKRAAQTLRDEVSRAWQRVGAGDSKSLMPFLRPNLGPAPAGLRRVLEPIVAASAMLALALLLGVGMASFSGFFVAAGLIYVIITYVFGIELGIEIPAGAW